ncbi:MAG TPA: branched-chain amino acid ABC transporter permease [Anaerolineales bacterium]|nr:branched-chain amino acid ABC transporter permease [Anaerolineales bacterium]
MPELSILPQMVLSGMLIGFIYALVSVGLTLIYGVMDIVNFAHGEFLMLAMYVAFWLYALIGLDPLLSLPVSVLALFVVGVLTYKLVIQRVLHAPMSAQIFATFGLMVLLQNGAQFLWSPDYHLIQEPLLAGRVEFLGLYAGKPQLFAAVGALLTTGIVYWFIERTETGRALQAVAEDREAAALMGVNSDRTFALAWGIGAACVGVAGALLANYYYIFPTVGTVFVLVAFVAVALGGFGSVPGALLAGVIIGIVEVLAGLFIGPAYKEVIVYILYMVVVLIRPQGLLGEW